MISPPYLKKGDAVALVATARKISPGQMEFALKTIESWGLVAVPGKNLFASSHQFAGNDEQRAADFQQAMDDKNIRAMICVRGGYGTVRIIDSLDFSHFKKNPKWIAGYSDITVLHSHIHSTCKIATIHGTMPINFKTNTEKALESLRSALFGKKLLYQVKRNKLNRSGQGEGIVTGGNLSILYSLSGTVSDIETGNKILFLEDLDEYLYHIDRMLMQLKRSGKLKNLRGLIIGGLTKMRDNEIPFGKTAFEIIADLTRLYNFPVCFGFPAGHINDNRAIYLGRAARLNVTSAGSTLEYL